ncbi:acyl-[acyl-carrier-protein]--UDP-N-acetylglucosamine O-acyltransferase, partial [Vibrio parahaemolyticus]|nr:acyl-[acyl-carrier-protein]--UDP-N-acetylglucosamine O-acyltransferase [Vibrio parahaemolyticus]
EALPVLKEMAEQWPSIQRFITMLETSERGIIR